MSAVAGRPISSCASAPCIQSVQLVFLPFSLLFLQGFFQRYVFGFLRFSPFSYVFLLFSFFILWFCLFVSFFGFFSFSLLGFSFSFLGVTYFF